MINNKDFFIRLYKMRIGLEKQIAEVEVLMNSLIEENPDSLNKVLNEITLGVYDFPSEGTDSEKVLFIGNKLKHFDLSDLLRYAMIMQYDLDKKRANEIIEKMIAKKLIRKTDKGRDVKYVIN